MTAADPGARPGTGDTGDEDLRWHRPSPRLLRARRIEVALVTVPLALIGGFAGGAASAVIGLIVGLGLVVLGLLAERFLARRVAAWGYARPRPYRRTLSPSGCCSASAPAGWPRPWPSASPGSSWPS